MFKFIKEVVKLGAVMFAGQLVFEGLYKAFKTIKGCGSENCCHHSHKITEKKEDKKIVKKKSR